MIVTCGYAGTHCFTKRLSECGYLQKDGTCYQTKAKCDGKERDCIAPRDYNKSEKCEYCPDRHTCAGDARGDSGMPHEIEQEEE